MSDPRPSATGFGNVDKFQDKQYFVDFLDLVRSRSAVREGKELSFSLLALKPGDVVLDVGCGTGDDVLSLAKIVGEKGRAIGIDYSEAMISKPGSARRSQTSRTSSFSQEVSTRLVFQKEHSTAFSQTGSSCT